MKLFYTLEEVAGHFELPSSTLEHYIRYFNIKVQKAGKLRKFSNANLLTFEKINDLVNKQGFTLEGAKERMKQKGLDPQKADLIKRLNTVKETLILLKNNIDG